MTIGTGYQVDAIHSTSPTRTASAGSYSGGVLTLTGSATPAQYQAALQSVTFSSTSTSTATRTVSMSLAIRATPAT